MKGIKIQIYLQMFFFVISIFSPSFSEELKNANVRNVNILDTIKNNAKKTIKTEKDSLYDFTIGADSTCELHHCKMFKDTVPVSTVRDTNLLRRYIGLLEQLRYDPFPHDGLLGERPGILYLCPKCVKARKEYLINKKYPVHPRGERL